MANPELLPQMDEAIGQVVIEGPLWSAMATVTPRSPEFWPGAALRCRWSASRPGPGARPSRCAIPPSTRWWRVRVAANSDRRFRHLPEGAKPVGRYHGMLAVPASRGRWNGDALSCIRPTLSRWSPGRERGCPPRQKQRVPGVDTPAASASTLNEVSLAPSSCVLPPYFACGAWTAGATASIDLIEVRALLPRRGEVHPFQCGRRGRPIFTQHVMYREDHQHHPYAP